MSNRDIRLLSYWQSHLENHLPAAVRRLRAAGERRSVTGCFKVLPFVGHSFWGRCGAPIAFGVYGYGECWTRDFGFEDARVPLWYEGVGEEFVHTFKHGDISASWRR